MPLLATLGLLLLTSVSTATAATYSVYSCTPSPGGSVWPNDAWLPSILNPDETLQYNFWETCGDLTVEALDAAVSGSSGGAEWVFDAPTGTTIAGYQLMRSARLIRGTPGTTAFAAGVRETTAGVPQDRDCDQNASACDIQLSEVTRLGLGLSSLAVGVYCKSGTGCPGIPDFSDLRTTLDSARVDVDDQHAPDVVSVIGTLPGSLAVAGSRSVEATATDLGGGVERVELSIDGGAPQVVKSGGGCQTPYTLRQPCPSGGLFEFVVDTSQLANGAHTGELRAFDAAGNVSTSEVFAFTVVAGGTGEGGLGPNNGTPAVEQVVLRSYRKLITAKSTRSVVVDGTLSTTTGQAIAGATLDSTSTDLGVFNSKARPLGKVTTDSNGHFSLRVTPRGAQRIDVLFRPTQHSIGTAVASTVVRQRLALSARVAKQRVRPGGLLRLSGKLDGAGAATRGTPVEIDVKIGNRWRAVDVVDAGSSGGFRWHYRFTRVTQPTSFTFRAVVRRNSSWPWPTTTSGQVRVLVAR